MENICPYSADECVAEGHWDEDAGLGSGDSGSGSGPGYLSYNGTDIGQFCAGYMAGDLDSCDYDEGGPLICIQDRVKNIISCLSIIAILTLFILTRKKIQKGKFSIKHCVNKYKKYCIENFSVKNKRQILC